MLSLTSDTLTYIFYKLNKDDYLPFSLTSLALRDAIFEFQKSKKMRTTLTSSLDSPLKIVWSLSCGMPFDSRLCTAAARCGNLDMLKWLYYSNCEMKAIDVYSAAAKNEHLHILKWTSQQCTWHPCACSAAAEKGHLNVLIWLRFSGCPWDKNACSMASLGGHLKVLQWLREFSCPWDSDVIINASKSGHLDVVEWINIEIKKGFR